MKRKKRINAAGEKEMRTHMKTVRTAKKELKKEASDLDKKIGKRMNFALSQDARIMKDMKKSDRKRKAYGK